MRQRRIGGRGIAGIAVQTGIGQLVQAVETRVHLLVTGDRPCGPRRHLREQPCKQRPRRQEPPVDRNLLATSQACDHPGSEVDGVRPNLSRRDGDELVDPLRERSGEGGRDGRAIRMSDQNCPIDPECVEQRGKVRHVAVQRVRAGIFQPAGMAGTHLVVEDEIATCFGHAAEECQIARHVGDARAAVEEDDRGRCPALVARRSDPDVGDRRAGGERREPHAGHGLGRGNRPSRPQDGCGDDCGDRRGGNERRRLSGPCREPGSSRGDPDGCEQPRDQQQQAGTEEHVRRRRQRSGRDCGGGSDPDRHDSKGQSNRDPGDDQHG
jgi:hypothetical protein